MANKIHRYAFNAGLISPDLWHRSDLSRFHQALRVAENVTVLPHGPVTRRPGSRVLRQLTDALANTETASIKRFEINATTYYWIVIYPYASASQLQVISSTGAILFTQDTDYLPADLDTIQFKQSYDVMFITHPLHKMRRLERTTATTWKWIVQPFKGGPIGHENTDRQKILSFEVPQWDLNTIYAKGDYVTGSATDTLLGTSARRLLRTTYEYEAGGSNDEIILYWYDTRVQPNSGTTQYRAGDQITIVDGPVAGTWTINKVDATYIYLNTATVYYDGADSYWVNNYDGLSVAGNTFAVAGSISEQIFQSLQDANENKPPVSEPTWWEPVNFFSSTQVVKSTGDIFDADQVGKLLRFTDPTVIKDRGNWGTSSEDTSSEALPVFGTVQLLTEGGIWAGVLVLELSYDTGITWEEVGSISSYDGERNGSFTRTITGIYVMCRVRMKERVTATGDTGCIWHLEISGQNSIYMEITSVTDARTAVVKVVSPVHKFFSTWRWAFGAFGGADGYPGTLDFYEERMVIAGIPGTPGVVYGSTIDDWDVWEEGVLADSPFKFTLRGGARNNIYWLLPMSSMVIGSDNSEHTLGARDRDEAMSGGNRSSQKRADYGVAPVPAISSGDRVFYVEAGGRNLRSMAYYWEKEGWDSDDMMGLCRHLLETYEITSMAFQRAPYSTLWCRRSDGKLLTFTFSQKEEVAAWTEQDLGGNVLDLATANATGGYDIACLVKRDNGLYLEIVTPTNDCRDFSYLQANTHAPTFDLFCIADEDALIVEDAIGAVIDDALMANTGYLVYFISPWMDGYTFTVTGDGVLLLEGVDYVISDSELTWILGSYTTLVFTRSDGAGLAGCYVIEPYANYTLINVFNPDVDFSTLVVNLAATPITTERFDQPDARQILVEFPVASGTWELVDDGRVMDASEYEVTTPGNIFCAANLTYPEEVLIGLAMTSEISPTDMAAAPDLGGPGGQIRSTMAEIYLHNSMGGEISNDDGVSWQDIKYMGPTTIPGVKLPLHSARHEVTLGDGWQRDGIHIRIRNSSSRQMTIAALGLNPTRNKGRQA